MDTKIASRVAARFRDETAARRVALRFAARQDRVLVKNKHTKRIVHVKPETLKERPHDFEVLQKVPGRNPGGRPDYHKDKLPEPPKLPKPALPDPLPRPKKPKKLPKPVPIPEPPKPKGKKPAPGQPGWTPRQR